MSFLKLSTILCCFLILQTQALPQNQALNKATTDVNDVIDIISGLVGNIESHVDKILNDLSVKLEEFIKNPHLSLKESIEGLLGKALDRFQALVDIHLNILKEDGNDDTKLIVGCIQQEKDNFKSVVNATFDKNSQCILTELVTLHKSFIPIVGDLQQVQGDVKKSLAKLDSCSGDDLEAIRCALDVIKDTYELAVKEIPEVTSEDVQNLIEIVKAFPQSLRTCIKSNAHDFRVNVVELINHISTCSRK